LKIQAGDIQAGDRIIAYCNNKMQICTVKQIIDPNLSNITLSVSTSESSRNSISRVVRFQRDALVELSAKVAEPDLSDSLAVSSSSAAQVQVALVEEGVSLETLPVGA
jgi:hypothetical protein